MHYVSTTNGIDHSEPFQLLTTNSAEPSEESWLQAQSLIGDVIEFDDGPEDGATFMSLPGYLSKAKAYTGFSTDVRDFLYRNKRLQLWKHLKQKLVSKPTESESDFRVRLAQAARELRDAEVDKLGTKYAPKIATLEERKRKAEQKVAKEKEQAKQSSINTGINILSTVLGAVFGRKLGSTANVGKAATTVRRARAKFLKNKAMSVPPKMMSKLSKPRSMN